MGPEARQYLLPRFTEKGVQELESAKFTKRDGRNVKSIELAVFLVDDGDRLVGEIWKTVDLTFTDDRLAVIRRDGVPIELTITTSAPPKHAKVIVYDAGDDLLGSAVVKVQ